MPIDPFANAADSLTSPAGNCFAIVPSDTVDLPVNAKAIYIGSGGNLVVLAMNAAAPVTLRNTIAGSILDIRVRRILATGTTAQDLVGLA
ncbi:spike base protein, RCAP_Rcc01079 family [Erythrobacter donghaensis]|uniref:spike base protein, RCAP_Rcc01079 family n=1 Tax=Erythrobacter donghaensis TaxID=267135 RepID=UPI000A367336|nr:hypothetical protein [Erythrobacter donghaensis]